MTRRPVAWMAAAALAVTACGSFLLGEVRELDIARIKWHRADIPSYAYTVRRSCFCGDIRSIRVTVQNGQITSLAYTDTSLAVDTTGYWNQELLTVERLFGMIERTLDEQPDTADATYDAQLGYPTRFQVDIAYNIADEEFTVAVSDFTPLPTPLSSRRRR